MMDDIKKTAIAAAATTALVMGFIANAVGSMGVKQWHDVDMMDKNAARNIQAENAKPDNWRVAVAQPKPLF